MMIRTALLTFGTDVQLCLETRWPSGDIDRGSRRYIVLEKFVQFLEIFVVRGIHLSVLEVGGSRKWRTHGAKNPPLCPPV